MLILTWMYGVAYGAEDDIVFNVTTEFVSYRGPQYDWPLSSEPPAMTEDQFRLPVYLDPPMRPYDIVGWTYVRVADGRRVIDVRQAAIKSASIAARGHHADALCIHPLNPREREALNATKDLAGQHVLMVGIAIKWKH